MTEQAYQAHLAYLQPLRGRTSFVQCGQHCANLEALGQRYAALQEMAHDLTGEDESRDDEPLQGLLSALAAEPELADLQAPLLALLKAVNEEIRAGLSHVQAEVARQTWAAVEDGTGLAKGEELLTACAGTARRVVLDDVAFEQSSFEPHPRLRVRLTAANKTAARARPREIVARSWTDLRGQLEVKPIQQLSPVDMELEQLVTELAPVAADAPAWTDLRLLQDFTRDLLRMNVALSESRLGAPYQEDRFLGDCDESLRHLGTGLPCEVRVTQEGQRRPAFVVSLRQPLNLTGQELSFAVHGAAAALRAGVLEAQAWAQNAPWLREPGASERLRLNDLVVCLAVKVLEKHRALAEQRFSSVDFGPSLQLVRYAPSPGCLGLQLAQRPEPMP